MSFHLHLDSECVRHIPAAEPRCIAPEVSVRTVLHQLREAKGDSVLVCEAGRLIGIFTERDALQIMADRADMDVPIARVMTSDPVTSRVDETVGSAILKMAVGGYRRLPVVDGDGCPVGLLKVSHILHYLVEHFPHVVYTLPPNPHHATQEREGA